MNRLELTKHDNVFLLAMIDQAKDNTFYPGVFEEWHRYLDEIEDTTERAALVLTSNHPKSWCLGINLDWLRKANEEELNGILHQVAQLAIRIALLNLPTVACITGNCYAGGAVLASAFDFRYMRADRGRFCFSEVNVGIPFNHQIFTVIGLLPNAHALNEMVLTGKALGGEECLSRNIVDAIYHDEALLSQSLAFAKTLAEKDRSAYTVIKRGMRKPLVQMQHAFRWSGKIQKA